MSGVLRTGLGLGSGVAEDARRSRGRRLGGDRAEGVDDYAHHAKWCMLVARTDADAPKHKGLTYFLMDMEQRGVQVRPLRQITGEAEFNELFIEGARIPDANIIGGEGNGWGVAITTLMHERATLAFGLQVSAQIALGELIEHARRARLRARHRRRGPVVRQRLAQLLIEAEVLRLNAYRVLSAVIRRACPGPRDRSGNGTGRRSTSR